MVRLKGGDPFVFGRGGEEIEVLDAAGIEWEVVPGVTSAFGVPAALGIPVTHRGLASSVTVVTGRVGETGGGPGPDWEALARAGGTLIVVMGTTTRDAVADALMRGGRAPDTPVAVISRGTLPAERLVRTTLAGLAGVELEAPALIVIGPVAALGRAGRDAPSGGALAGRTVVATRSGQRAVGLTNALEQAGAVVVQLPLTRTVDPADGGDAVRAAAASLATFDWVVFTSQNAVDRLMAEVRDARRPGRGGRGCSGSGDGRRARAWPAWNQTWCRPSTARAAWSRSSPTAPVACCFRAPTWRPTPSRPAWERRGGR